MHTRPQGHEQKVLQSQEQIPFYKKAGDTGFSVSLLTKQ